MDSGAFDPVQQSLDASLEHRAAERRHESILSVVHRRLRGRYPLVAAMAVAFMIPGAWLGYRAKKPEFRSTGLVHIAPSLPVTLYSTRENQMLAAYDTFVETQARLIEDRRVIDRAVDDPELRAAGWPGGLDGVKQLKSALNVRRGRRDEIIEVSVGHAERVPAQRAVNAVLTAYRDLYGERDRLTTNDIAETLSQRERELKSALATFREQIMHLTDEYGPEMLATLHTGKAAQIEQLDRQLAHLDAAIAHATAQGGGEDLDPAVLLDSIVAADPRLADLRDRATQLEAVIDVESKKYGPNHRMMKQRRADLESIQAQIRARAEELVNASHEGAVGPDPMSRAPFASVTNLPAMRDMRTRLVEQRERVQADAAALNNKRNSIASLTEQIEETKVRLAETRRRLDEIKIETDGGRAGRISVMRMGDLPVDPDDKRLTLAAGGAMFGACFGAGLVFLLGFFDRGYRYIDDIERTSLSAPLLGTLPDLSSGSVESSEMAALSVHHLRNMLQLQHSSPDGAGRVYTVTSAASGDGKTSLSLALGMSFAVSGQRTLLLDADLVGRGLTRELKLDAAPGLCQAIQSETINGEVHPSAIENLWTIPAGVADNIDAKHISHAGLERIIRRLRAEFDIVLIDTGPLLGSLEANLAAALCDGVVLTVSRGQSHRFVEACLARLERMNARCVGLVFNRADMHDFDRSVSGASMVSQSMRSTSPAEKEPLAQNGRAAGGALVRAVVGPAHEAEAGAKS